MKKNKTTGRIIEPRDEKGMGVSTGTLPYDKYTVLANIRKLLAKSTYSMGEFEKLTGVSPGYMSRLEKKENEAEPSLRFVVSAAEIFEVTVDYLIRSSRRLTSPIAEYWENYLEILQKKTMSEEITWERVEDNEVFREVIEPYKTYDFTAKIYGFEINTEIMICLVPVLRCVDKNGNLKELILNMEVWCVTLDESKELEKKEIVLSAELSLEIGNQIKKLYNIVDDYERFPKVSPRTMAALNEFIKE